MAMQSKSLTPFDYTITNFVEALTVLLVTKMIPRFTAMMLAKVISVQLVNMLGYNLLFSDVDIIWYKNPLDYFLSPESPVKDHDVIFQDDGSRTLRYGKLMIDQSVASYLT